MQGVPTNWPDRVGLTPPSADVSARRHSDGAHPLSWHSLSMGNTFCPAAAILREAHSPAQRRSKLGLHADATEAECVAAEKAATEKKKAAEQSWGLSQWLGWGEPAGDAGEDIKIS